MSKLISFTIAFSSELSPASLLAQILDTGFNSYMRPKVGQIILDKKTFKFGDGYESHEKVLAPDITSLEAYPDATKDIIAFLKQNRSSESCAAEFHGDTLLEYYREGKIIEGWLSRYGSSDYILPIVSCYVSHFGDSTLLGIIVNSPNFFLKSGWLDENASYSSPETADHNWGRLLSLVEFVVNSVGSNELKKISLHLEGSPIHQEKDWLLTDAQKLSKLEVDFS